MRRLDQQHTTVTGSLSLGGQESIMQKQQQSFHQVSGSTQKEVGKHLFSQLSSKNQQQLQQQQQQQQQQQETPYPGMPSMSAHHGRSSNEPKLTPSISNIGSAVLRSKTADFERLLSKNNNNNKASTSDNPDSISSPQTTVAAATSSSVVVSTSKRASDLTTPTHSTEVRGSKTSSSSTTSSTTSKRSGPIYKRQEIISSVQSSKK